jgi:hypothetical protein
MSLTQLLLIFHLLAISLGLGIGFSNLVGFRVAKSLGGEKAMGIGAHRESLLPYGDVIFVTILASGMLLLWLKYDMQVPSPWFHAKMAAVVVWVVCFVMMRLRVRKFIASRDTALLPLVRTYAHVMITAVTVALICAVMAFAA